MTTPGSGLSAQIGFATESTYGTPVTVTRFLPVLNESIKTTYDRVESAAIIAGHLVLTSNQWAAGNITVGGQVGLELSDRSMGLLLKHCLGTVVTTGSGPYTHTITPGTLAGLSFTTQVGRPASSATVHPFTFPGCKVVDWAMGFAQNANVTFGANIVAQNEIAGVRATSGDGHTTSGSPIVTSATGAFGDGDIGSTISGSITGIPAGATIIAVASATSCTISANATATTTTNVITIGSALAAASFTSGISPINYFAGSLSVNGSVVANCISGEVKGTTGIKVDRRFLGDNTISEPIQEDLRDYTATLKLEFLDLTQYHLYANASEAALSLAFTAPSGNSVTVSGNLRLDAADTVVASNKVLEQDLTAKLIASSTDASAITVVLVNGDSTA